VLNDGAIDNIMGDGRRDWFFGLGGDNLVDRNAPSEFLN
jgi:hypothetical protein